MWVPALVENLARVRIPVSAPTPMAPGENSAPAPARMLDRGPALGLLPALKGALPRQEIPATSARALVMTSALARGVSLVLAPARGGI